jgi:rRNA maturation endonuclease Nob1
MQKYKCSDCQGVFCGWAIIIYKYKNKCPVCGGELREISNNKESRKVERYHKEDSEDSLSKILRLDI